MGKDKNNALDANELEAVAGGKNKYVEELCKSGKFDPEWTLSKSWDCELVDAMISVYGEDKTTKLTNKYKTPEAMFYDDD